MRAADGQEAEADCAIAEPYLLALNVGLRRHDGGFWADASWAKDLAKHRAYLHDLTLFCPVERRAPEPGWVRVDSPGLRIEGYRAHASRAGFLLALPIILWRLGAAVRRTRLVHSGVAGWPFPLGWAAVPLARLWRRPLVLIVESTFWRIPVGEAAGPLRRLETWAWERAARACLAHADYAAYTQPEYQRTLPSPRAGGGRLVQASWVDAADCASDAAADAAWAGKLAAPPRFLFAARLLRPKGTSVLAEALELLAERDAPVAIDIIGEGPERDRLADAATATAWARAHVRLLDPIPYDRVFLDFVGTYQALLVPGLSDEQPRIVYDGYARAVPAIGSDLPGLRACVADGGTGRLVAAGDADALATAIVSAAGAPDQLRGWGMAGLRKVRTLTHDRLHRDRCHDLRALLDRTPAR